MRKMLCLGRKRLRRHGSRADVMIDLGCIARIIKGWATRYHGRITAMTMKIKTNQSQNCVNQKLTERQFHES